MRRPQSHFADRPVCWGQVVKRLSWSEVGRRESLTEEEKAVMEQASGCRCRAAMAGASMECPGTPWLPKMASVLCVRAPHTRGAHTLRLFV